MKNTNSLIGKTAVAVVQQTPDSLNAIITALTVKEKRRYIKKRVSFAGNVTFEKKTIDHIEKNILPMVNQIARLLGLDHSKKAYEISITNPAIASVADRGLEISGFSADLPVFLALLSCALNIPLAQDFVATGHIASASGDIGPVRALLAKVNAAAMCKQIKCFILPAAAGQTPVDDSSTPPVCQAELIAYAKRFFDVIQADHIGRILPQVFSDRDIVIASLENNFFEDSPDQRSGKNNLTEIVSVFTADNNKRFWKILSDDLTIGDVENVKKLLSARVDYQLANQHYPKGFGSKLLQKILAVSPAIRRTKLAGELIDINRYFDLCRFADADDLKKDSRYLRDAFEGVAAQKETQQFLNESLVIQKQPVTREDMDTLFSQISGPSLCQKITRPLDQARAAYVLEKTTVDSTEEFLDQMTSFYIHLLGHTALAPAQVDPDLMRSSALELVRRTFSNSGGLEAACQEGRDGFNGGMNLVLNQVTEQLKFEQKTGYIKSVLARVVDQADFEQRILFTEKLLQYIGPWLPPELKNRPASTLADRYPQIITAYVESLDRLQQKLRAF